MNTWNRLTQWTEAEGPLKRLAFCRIVVGFMVWRHTWAFVRRYVSDGFYADKFYVAYWAWYPHVSEPTYLIVMGLMIAAGFLVIVGYKTRLALIVAFATATFHLFLNQFWYGHNRYFLLLLLLLLAVSPCERVLSIDARQRPLKDWGPTWSSILIRLQMTLIYLASVIAKSVDPDWRSGNVLWDRGLNVAVEELRMMEDVPPFFIAILSDRRFVSVMTVAALCQEYFLAFGLWLPWTRRLAIWVGLVFHGFIEVTDAVLAFSYLTLSTYFLVISPHRRNRGFHFNPNTTRHKFWARWLRRLDWFDKIRFVADDSPTIRVKDADGRWYQGWMAVAIASSALVLPYPIAYPLTWLRFFGVGRILPETSPDSKNATFSSLMSPLTARLVLPLLLVIYVSFLCVVTGVPAVHMDIHGVKFVDLFLIFVVFALATVADSKDWGKAL